MNISLPTRLNQRGLLMVLVIGGRAPAEEYPVYDMLDRIEALCDFAIPKIEMAVLQGGTPGVAALARSWAWHNNRHLFTERVDWRQSGARHGAERARYLLEQHQPDLCLACLPGGPAVHDMLARCRTSRIPIVQVTAGDDGAAVGQRRGGR